MRSISVEDLHERTAELVSDVREKNVSYVVRSGDDPVAFLSPLAIPRPEDDGARRPPPDGGWKDYERLADDLRARWPADRDTRSLLEAIRR